MAITNPEIVKFAAGNTDFYEAAYDNYFNPTAEKSELLNKAFFAEVERQSGVSRDTLRWETKHAVHEAAFAVVDATVAAIFPAVMTNAFSTFMEMKYVGPGDIAKFRVKPGSLFVVEQGARGERIARRQRKFDGDVLVTPREHMITVYENMYRILSGKANIADLIRLAVISMEQAMYGEGITALNNGLAAATNGTPFTYSGAFSVSALIEMAQRVQAHNAGVRPVIAGSSVALMNVLPDSTSGFRGVFDADGGVVDIVKKVYGYDVIVLDQAMGTDGNLVLPNNTIYVVSPSQDKLVKMAVSDSLTNGNEFYDNADITQDFTMRKNFAAAYASAAKAGLYTITE